MQNCIWELVTEKKRDGIDRRQPEELAAIIGACIIVCFKNALTRVISTWNNNSLAM